ncbi:MAG: four helix bundle protein [Deltaproteobacteria bacterium RBG_13_61_14]|nr:MAG: four helix bundle protein [Deltaproteobacteria bacterium RBG_13_61_14]
MLDLKTEAGKTKIKDFTELVVWQKAHQLVLEVYRITRTFPEEERYGITSQMRRAAVSIAANVAEGFKRRGLKVKIQSYSISQGSLEEVKYYLILAKDLGYLKDNEKLLDLCDQGGRLLTALIISIRNA